MIISKEQQEEFKQRQAKPMTLSWEEISLYHKNWKGPRLTSESYLEFLNFTNEKCK